VNVNKHKFDNLQIDSSDNFKNTTTVAFYPSVFEIVLSTKHVIVVEFVL